MLCIAVYLLRLTSQCLCVLQIGSVCHLVPSDEPGTQACSLDSLRKSVHLGLLNQIIGVRDPVLRFEHSEDQ